MIKRTSASEHARSGLVRFGYGVQFEWGLRRLANPCTTRHVFNAHLTENARRREWQDESDAQSSRQERRDVTRREKSDAEDEME